MRPKIKTKVIKPFLKKKLAVALAMKELKPEALSAIRDVTGSRVERLHPLVGNRVAPPVIHP